MSNVSTAAPQAGVFAGLNPSQFNPSDPIVLFIIQTTIILVFCRLITIPLRYLRQPSVISEVIAGIILGPTVMGRIPGFKDAIFPTQSLPFLNLVATLGLVFFLFQVGLEVEMQVIKKDWRKSVSIAVAGMAVPFGLGAAVSVGLYKLQNDSDIPFGSFLLFLGVAMSITAFPVLARILAELNLLRTKVGVITMASGLINDCTAWVLLALVVALMNSSGGIVALYVFLTAIGFTLFVIFIIGPLYYKLCVSTNSFEEGPSPLLMTVTLMLVLICAFVTNIIGIHSIFGGFLAGVIIPHENNLSIKITEKIEDIVNIIFLPLYFTLSGLKTQIGLLDTGTVWGYVILVIFLACFGKIVGCTAAARFSGMTTRESFTVGFLMNCKGLVELIVLNIGHDSGVLNDQVFVIMVCMALVTTFMTTPVVIYLYPKRYQNREEDISDNDISTTSEANEKDSIQLSTVAAARFKSYCIVTMLNRIESAPSIMALIQLLKRDRIITSVEFHALRLLELTQRTSVVMKYNDLRETERQDPVLNVLRTFAHLIGIKSLHTHLIYCPAADYIKAVSNYGSQVEADLIVLPWFTRQGESSKDSYPELFSNFDLEFAFQAFSTVTFCNTGLLVDRGFGHSEDGDDDSIPQIIAVYRENCMDDREAIFFALKLQAHNRCNLTVVRKGSPDAGILYPTEDNIRKYAQDLDINGLFADNESGTDLRTSVICLFVEELSGPAIARSLVNPLNKHNLIILGRGHDSPAEREEHECENTLGKLGSELLRDKTTSASVLIVQSSVGSLKK